MKTNYNTMKIATTLESIRIIPETEKDIYIIGQLSKQINGSTVFEGSDVVEFTFTPDNLIEVLNKIR